MFIHSTTGNEPATATYDVITGSNMEDGEEAGIYQEIETLPSQVEGQMTFSMSKCDAYKPTTTSEAEGGDSQLPQYQEVSSEV